MPTDDNIKALWVQLFWHIETYINKQCYNISNICRHRYWLIIFLMDLVLTKIPCDLILQIRNIFTSTAKHRIINGQGMYYRFNGFFFYINSFLSTCETIENTIFIAPSEMMQQPTLFFSKQDKMRSLIFLSILYFHLN